MLKFILLPHCMSIMSTEPYVSSLLFIGLDEEMQVELVHVIQDVVAVCSDQVLVVVDFLLW